MAGIHLVTSVNVLAHTDFLNDQEISETSFLMLDFCVISYFISICYT